MRKIVMSAAAALSLVLGIGLPSAAMSQQATLLEASSPLRQRADPLIKMVFDGDLAGAAALLKANAAPGSPAAKNPDELIAALKEMFDGGGYEVVRVVQAMGPGALAAIGNKPGTGRVALAILLEPTAPHRFRDLNSVRAGSGGNR